MRFILIKESILILILSLFLVLGYLVLDKNILSALTEWDTVSPEVPSQKWKVLSEVYGYEATNMFDKGYAREIGSDFHRRLLVYPEGTFLEKGRFVVPSGSLSRGIIKLTLPEGFRDGLVSLRGMAKVRYRIGVSYDLKTWEFYDYPGYNMQTFYSVILKKKDLASEAVYLKFLPSKDDNLSVYFDWFQYTSGLLYDKSEYYGLLFPSDIDIDYEGKEIKQPGIVVHVQNKSETNH